MIREAEREILSRTQRQIHQNGRVGVRKRSQNSRQRTTQRDRTGQDSVKCYWEEKKTEGEEGSPAFIAVKKTSKTREMRTSKTATDAVRGPCRENSVPHYFDLCPPLIPHLFESWNISDAGPRDSLS